METLDWHLAGCPVDALVGHLARPFIKVGFKGGPGRKAAPGDGVLLDIPDAALVLPFVRARYGAQARGRKPQCLAKARSRALNSISWVNRS